MPLTEHTIGEFLRRYGKALSVGDLQAIADCWGIPALVLSDQGARAVSEVAEIHQFFADAVEWYRSQGLVETKHELERVEHLGQRLVSVDVIWNALDQTGAKKSTEHSRYILSTDVDGFLRIRVAISIAE